MTPEISNPSQTGGSAVKAEVPAYLASLWQALSEIGLSKPNDRSEKDRMFAIAKTDLEKLIAYCEHWLNR